MCHGVFDVARRKKSVNTINSIVMTDTPMSDVGLSTEETDLTLSAYSEVLLGGPAIYTARDLAAHAHCEVCDVNEYWESMGFPQVSPDELVFTARDLEAYKLWGSLIESGDIDGATGRSLIRAHSHLADRLALWQVEALVEDAVRRLGLDDTSARLYVLDHMRSGLDVLRDSFIHAWQRQLAALIERTSREVALRGKSDVQKRFPLNRSLGFVDMVSYTSTSTIIGDRLPDLVTRFEDVTRSAVTQSGGRVVKMIGDAVLFIADDLGTGLEVVTTLIDRLQADDDILPVRASFVRGDVFSRSGDVFGPTVNLAARLAAIAPEGRILTDATTAAAINAGHGGSGYSVDSFPPAELRGVGKVRPFLLSRDFSAQLDRV